MRQIIRLTESDLHQVIKESVTNILKESYNDDDTYMYNYQNAISDSETNFSIDTLFDILKEEGYDLPDYPLEWQIGNWMFVLETVKELGMDVNAAKNVILKHLKTNVHFAQKSIEAIQEY